MLFNSSNISDIDEISIEDSPEIEEIIEELSKLGAKGKKLKELVVQYSSSKADNTKPRSVQNIYEADNLIRIVRKILKRQDIKKLI